MKISYIFKASIFLLHILGKSKTQITKVLSIWETKKSKYYTAPFITLLICLLSNTIGFTQDELDISETTTKAENIKCFSYPQDSLIVINSKQALMELAQKSNSDYYKCNDYEMPEIDFAKRTLMLYHGTGGGCGILKTDWKLYYDVQNRKGTLKLRVEEVGTCRGLQYYFISILTPKIESAKSEINFVRGKMRY